MPLNEEGDLFIITEQDADNGFIDVEYGGATHRIAIQTVPGDVIRYPLPGLEGEGHDQEES